MYDFTPSFYSSFKCNLAPLLQHVGIVDSHLSIDSRLPNPHSAPQNMNLDRTEENVLNVMAELHNSFDYELQNTRYHLCIALCSVHTRREGRSGKLRQKYPRLWEVFGSRLMP